MRTLIRKRQNHVMTIDYEFLSPARIVFGWGKRREISAQLHRWAGMRA